MDSGRTSRTVVGNSAKHLEQKPKLPRVLIEEWLPAAAIGVECIRERSTGQQPQTSAFTSGGRAGR